MFHIDESALKSSLEASQRRREAAHARKIKQQRQAIGLVVLLFVGVPLFYGLLSGVLHRVAAPAFVVNWPDPAGSQLLGPGARVTVESGSPFVVSVSDPVNWDVTWHASSGADARGLSYKWQPAADGEKLLAICHRVPRGMSRFTAFLWPATRLELQAVEPAKLTRHSFSLSAQQMEAGGVWLAPHVYAPKAVAYDNRAVYSLESTNKLVAVPAQNSSPSGAWWSMATDFGNGAPAPKPSVDESNGVVATYATLQAQGLATLAPRLGNALLRWNPGMSLKFIVRLDTTPQEAIFRIAYDGSRDRHAWVRHPGQSAGGPLVGWNSVDDGPPIPSLLPSLPEKSHAGKP